MRIREHGFLFASATTLRTRACSFPNVIIGSNGTQPTAAGDYGGTISGGEYTPDRSRWFGFSARISDGVGGYARHHPERATIRRGQRGSAFRRSRNAVYEVVDSNPAAIESAQIPIFLGLTRTIEARTLTLEPRCFFRTNLEIVRSVPEPARSRDSRSRLQTIARRLNDCQLYLPKLEAYPAGTDFVAVSGANFQMRYLPFENVGGGVMVWTARVEYKNGSDWARVYPTSGFQGNTLRLDVIPMGLRGR